MALALDIHQSQVSCLQRCPHAYQLTYVQNIERRYDGIPINLGTAVHAGLDHALRGHRWEEPIREFYDKVVAKHPSQEQMDELAETCEKAANICARTMAFLDLGHRWETVHLDGRPLVEYSFRVPADIYHTFGGRIDWVCREIETGNRFLWDHKVRKQLQPDDHEVYNQQMALYQYLLNRFENLNIKGSIAFQIRAATPREPPLLKSGKALSRSDIISDWPTYAACIVRHGLNLDDYEDMREKLEKKEWFRISRAFRNDGELGQVFDDAIIQSIPDLERLHAGKVGKRHVSAMNCPRCLVNEYCQAELRGHDLDFLMRTTFKLRGQEPLAMDPSAFVLEDDETPASLGLPEV